MDKTYLKLKLDYRGSDYSRTVDVPKELSLVFLHEVIQVAFGWLNYHEYQFTDAKGNLYEADAEGDDLARLDASRKIVEASGVAIGKLLKKPGDRLLYTYDLGDGNEIEIQCLDVMSTVVGSDFKSVGPDLVEDSAAFGFTPGIVKLLSKKGRKTASAKECEAWLEAAFGKNPQSVLREPYAEEIFNRVWRLISFVYDAFPTRG